MKLGEINKLINDYINSLVSVTHIIYFCQLLTSLSNIKISVLSVNQVSKEKKGIVYCTKLSVFYYWVIIWPKCYKLKIKSLYKHIVTCKATKETK